MLLNRKSRESGIDQKIPSAQHRQIAESTAMDQRERLMDSFFRVRTRYRRFYCRGTRFFTCQRMVGRFLDATWQSPPLLGMDGTGI